MPEILTLQVDLVRPTARFDSAFAEEMRAINDGLGLVQDFFHNKAEVDIKYRLIPTQWQGDWRQDYYQYSRTFPTVYLLPTGLLYSQWLGYSHAREAAEIAAEDNLWPYTVMHELGHLLGLEHNQYTFMHPEMSQVSRLQLISSEEKETLRSNVERYGRRA